MEKEGVFTGSYAINPVNGEKIPVYAGNFVLADYGSGMVMAVPAHDQRDFEFAKKYSIPIKVVINPAEYDLDADKISRAYTADGRLINSSDPRKSKISGATKSKTAPTRRDGEDFDGFDNWNSREAIEGISDFLEKKKFGKRVVQFKLRDWLISRQRYWGTPIPIIYCDDCGIVPVSEKDLPIELPKNVKFGKGNPLETNKKFVEVKCPKCGGKGRRETDTMDTFANSSWYYLRYADPKNSKKIFDEKKANYWAPIDQYIGGPEHITMHLIYVRFYTKFLRDLGLLKFDEPALKYFTQGIVHAADGSRMSKSKGNIIEPLDMIKKYGADTLRLALVSFASPDKDTNWDEKIVLGNHKFLNKVWDYFSDLKNINGKVDLKVESKLNKTIKEVTDYVDKFKHNLAIIRLRELFDCFDKIDKKTAEKFLIMLHVYCPFITEELWNKIGNKGFISQAKWPKFDEKKIDEKFEKAEKESDGLVGDINNLLRIMEEKKQKVEKVYVYVLPNEVDNYFAEELSKRSHTEVVVYSVADKDKYDPEGKSKKAKPGKPGIYLE